ncbi:MAG: alpha/beta fold hydrolase, partial [Bdellovibrionales bacterium]|nr:alpha/beta fold hydrolase [Bdellovibrionales bacterium]
MTSFGDVAAIESDGELPLLVFLHGIQGTKELFLPILKEPFVRKHATLAIDFLGFGESSVSHDFDYSISSFACAVEEILHPRASAVVLIGHSLGGMVATRLLESGL